MSEDLERKMFGETVEEMKRAKPGFYSDGLYAMSILSDVQEILVTTGDIETARQWINKAKFFISQGDFKL